MLSFQQNNKLHKERHKSGLQVFILLHLTKFIVLGTWLEGMKDKFVE